MNRSSNNGQNGYVETDMFDLGGFLRLVSSSVRHQKKLVLVTCALTLLLVIVYVILWPPIYKVEAKLAAERDLDPARDTFYSNWQVFRKNDPRDEIQLFTAGPVLKDVIAKNKLTYDDVYHPFLTHASYLWEKSWPGRAYTAIKRTISSEPELLDPQQKELGRTMDGLKEGIHIAGVADSHIATLEVMGPKRNVDKVANSLIDSFLEYRANRQEEEARAAVNVLNEEAERARIELDQVRDKRIKFARENGLMVEFQKESLDVKELTGIETGISNESSKVASLEASLQEINKQQQGEKPAKILSSTQEVNAVRENAKLRRLDLQTTLIGLRDRYREDSPEIQEVLANISKLDALIAQEPEKVDRSVTEGVNSVHQQLTSNRDQIESELAGTKAAVTSLKQTADQMKGRLTQLPKVMSIALDLNRDYDVAAEKYKRLLFRKMEAEVSATAMKAAPATVSVIDYAVPPSSKYWPRAKYLYPGALVVGLLLGVIAAVIRSLTAGRLLQDHIDRGRVAFPVYATIAAGGRGPALTVIPRPPDRADSPLNAPRDNPDAGVSQGVGA